MSKRPCCAQSSAGLKHSSLNKYLLLFYIYYLITQICLWNTMCIIKIIINLNIVYKVINEAIEQKCIFFSWLGLRFLLLFYLRKYGVLLHSICHELNASFIFFSLILVCTFFFFWIANSVLKHCKPTAICITQIKYAYSCSYSNNVVRMNVVINVALVIFQGNVVMAETVCLMYQSIPQMAAEWSWVVRNWLWLKICFIYLNFNYISTDSTQIIVYSLKYGVVMHRDKNKRTSDVQKWSRTIKHNVIWIQLLWQGREQNMNYMQTVIPLLWTASVRFGPAGWTSNMISWVMLNFQLIPGTWVKADLYSCIDWHKLCYGIRCSMANALQSLRKISLKSKGKIKLSLIHPYFPFKPQGLNSDLIKINLTFNIMFNKVSVKLLNSSLCTLGSFCVLKNHTLLWFLPVS